MCGNLGWGGFLATTLINDTPRKIGCYSQGSASCMASVGSALLCSLLASFSADVSCKSALPEP